MPLSFVRVFKHNNTFNHFWQFIEKMHHFGFILRIQAMGSNYEQFFKNVPHEEMPAYLCERICLALERERERHARTRLVLSSLSGISSITGLMFAIPALIHAADVTGFTSYAPLLISDSDLITSHLGTFGMSLLEALPGFEVTVTLFLIAVLLVSIQNFVRGIMCAHFSFTHNTSHQHA